MIFPSIEHDARLKEGAFPNLDNLRNVEPGLSKDGLYELLGRPHFREGLMGLREWDWILNPSHAAGREGMPVQGHLRQELSGAKLLLEACRLR